ncbi:hypothetical protein [Mesorhizobium sp. B2-1-2]|uniref:hypothetical protein n=1 Tax=Mesorhizobium sp. B2-1-2 TaxID=2589973 RepID=UPI001127F9EF|nr:hypothetical protein [Mesorhizobium sp. B2-1-2]TPN04508.1 hypothetical protein FJ971_29625 [Mesorhizobium sp. B2-1-2]
MTKVYRSRRSAVRAARNACRRALDAPTYSAYEGPDYIIHPVDDDTPLGGTYEGPSRFELRGPALDAAREKETAGE